MAAPNVQIYTNAGKMKIYCDFVSYQRYVAYDLYYSTDSGMSGAKSVGIFLNGIDGMYSKKHVMYQFTRPVAEGTIFYLQLVGVFAGGSEDSGNSGAIKYVPAVSDNLPLYKPVQIEGFDGHVFRPVEVNTAGAIVTTETGAISAP
jgi:hypothetical protein